MFPLKPAFHKDCRNVQLDLSQFIVGESCRNIYIYIYIYIFAEKFINGRGYTHGMCSNKVHFSTFSYLILLSRLLIQMLHHWINAVYWLESCEYYYELNVEAVFFISREGQKANAVWYYCKVQLGSLNL